MDYDDSIDSDDGNQRFVFVIGPPGAGKATLAKQLAKEFDFAHVSVGELLRENADKDPAVGWHVQNSELLPSEFLFPLLREAFRDGPSGCPIVVDGFPRRMGEVRGFEKLFGVPHLVLFFHCPRDLAKARVMGRKDGRPGDTGEGFDKRYQEYLEHNPAILDYYGSTRGKDKLVEVRGDLPCCSMWCVLIQ
ncbi:hypothetical protein NEMBOFW57_007663 [Staphylotrichum longicolle]|uniref:P-loop containing nucleoside triphosphate hydrolase protein n=1 Tax=Staphylotrichum longicolle TaxID=669026 RepID=A0AAD4HVB8_9PEZI|nr:hypothetical protein NEMBOFW57_007663 [Staphylotrichum longicolle]